MNDAQFAELTTWISNAGLSGQDETTMLTEFCARIVAHGLPMTRAQAFIDTLHPIHGGRAYTWQIAKGQTTATEYAPANDGEMLARWQQSPFYRLIQSGSSVLRLRLTKDGNAEYPCSVNSTLSASLSMSPSSIASVPTRLSAKWIAFIPRGRPTHRKGSPTPRSQRFAG
jgi:adenylate cyclase